MITFPASAQGNHVHMTDRIFYIAAQTNENQGECRQGENVRYYYLPCTRITALDTSDPSGRMAVGATTFVNGTYPAARRVMVATNYRCPAAVIEASARMVAVNRERFAKPIRAPGGIDLDPQAISAHSTANPGWPDTMARLAAAEDRAGRTVCFLSRTRGELTPILLALVRAGVRHTAAIPPIVEAERALELLGAARDTGSSGHPFHVLRRLRLGRGWDRCSPSGDLLSDDDHAALDALLGWATGFRTVEAFAEAFAGARARIAALRDPGAPVELATVHVSKGREWETVVLVGFEADRIPNRRSLVDARTTQCGPWRRSDASPTSPSPARLAG